MRWDHKCWYCYIWFLKKKSVPCKLPSVSFRVFRAAFTLQLNIVLTPHGNTKSFCVHTHFGFEWQSKPIKLFAFTVDNSWVLNLVHFCSVYQNSTGQLTTGSTVEWDIKTPEVSHFPLLKNVWKQRCFMVRKQNKIAFKCLGRGGHLKETEENREGLWQCRGNQKKRQTMLSCNQRAKDRVAAQEELPFKGLNVIIGTIQMLFVATEWITNLKHWSPQYSVL